ncbi:hypothetical protein DYI95_002490 [Thermaerobacter sp. PB12/4term]|uniref:hypothetical protein n=1 Tax=Thermaerobacter sp. PB12/4term TaxID=2293838 RepID=UPI0013142011|nr:hypothetical protein [Thermaerobacter sp. PB12/4term]QIA26551.1 hypothetical protein DYI95_002490 [Thermaerobacter sp. PB12/4term]
MDNARIAGRGHRPAVPPSPGAPGGTGAACVPGRSPAAGTAGGLSPGTVPGRQVPRYRWRRRWQPALPALALLLVILALVAAGPAGAASPGPASLEDLLVPDRYFIVTADEMVGRGASVMPVTEPGAGPFEVIVRFESAEIRNLALTQDLSQGSPLYLQITSQGVARVTGTAMRTDLLSLIGTIPGAARSADPVRFVLDLLESGGQVTLRVRDMGMRATWMHTGTAVLPGSVLRFVTDPAELAQRDRIQRVERQAAALHGTHRDLYDLRRDRQRQQAGAGPALPLPLPDLPLPQRPGPGIPPAPLPDLPLPRPRIPTPDVPGVPLPPEARNLVQCLEEALDRDPLSLLDLGALQQGDLEAALEPLRGLDPQAVVGCLGEEPAPAPEAGSPEAPDSGTTRQGSMPALPLPVQPQLPGLTPALACVAQSLDLSAGALQPLAGDPSLAAAQLLGGLVEHHLVEPEELSLVTLQLARDCGRYWPDLDRLATSLPGGTGSPGPEAAGQDGTADTSGTGSGTTAGDGQGGLLPLLGGLLGSAGLGGLLRKGP